MSNVRLALSLALAAHAAAPSAPAPPPRPARPAALTPGAYALDWGGSRWELALSPGGGYECSCGGQRWWGSWAWCPHTRTLSVAEAPAGSADWRLWSAVLDARLAGSAGQTGVRLVRKEVKG